MKVLIVRLFARQYEYIRQAYDGPHTLEYIDQETPAQIFARAKSADKIIAIPKFMSHAQWDQLPREKLIFVDSVNVDKILFALDELPDDPPKKIAVHPDLKREPRVHIKKQTIQEDIPMSSSTTRKVGNFVLTSAIPYPESSFGGNKGHRRPIYPFEQMNVGESFFVESTDLAAARRLQQQISASYAYYRTKHAPRTGWRTAIRKADSPDGLGVRCWRMKDSTEDYTKRKPRGRTASKNNELGAH